MRSAIKRFSSDTKGSFGILMGLLLLPMTLGLLMGIEYFRLAEFRDKLDSVATQVAVASAAGKQRSETQRLAEGRMLLSRVMSEHKLNSVGNSGTLTVAVRGDGVTSTVKLEAKYKYEFGALLRQSDKKLVVERTIKQRTPGAGGGSGNFKGKLSETDEPDEASEDWSH